MAESLDSRKFERKSMFDVPLPIRKAQRDKTENLEDEDEAPEVEAQPLNTMAFSLMTKKGNRQQVRDFFKLTTLQRVLIGVLLNCANLCAVSDAYHRTPVGLQLCRVDEVPASGRT